MWAFLVFSYFFLFLIISNIKALASKMEIIKYICPSCHSAMLQTHPDRIMEQLGWLKCSLCAFCTRFEKPTIKRDKKDE